jgi:hypothetical protein
MRKVSTIVVLVGLWGAAGCGDEAKKGGPAASVTNAPKPSATASTKPAATGNDQGGW